MGTYADTLINFAEQNRNKALLEQSEARVQLLAKALEWYAKGTEKRSQWDGGEIARTALREAGLDE